MMRIIAALFGKILFWSICVAVFFIVMEWRWRPPVERGNLQSLQNYLNRKLRQAQVNKRIGSAALVLIYDGKITEEVSYDSTPGEDSMDKLYLLCSVSKSVSAWGVMRLVQDGKLGLDDPILPHLKRWSSGQRRIQQPGYRTAFTFPHIRPGGWIWI